MSDPQPVSTRSLNRTGGALALLCVAQSLLFLPLAGLQADEVLFLGVLFDPRRAAYTWNTVFGRIPLMLMPYLGATKSLAYAGFVRWCAPGPVVVRLPMALLGAGAIYLLFRLLASIVPARTALAVAGLLAVDTTYLICTTLDWGPAAVQIFTVVAAGFLLSSSGRPTAGVLAGVAFLAGFLVWNKAVFLFNLAGFAIAGALVYGRALKWPSRKPLIAAAGAFLLGCLPLAIYNGALGVPTWRVETSLQPYNSGFKVKAAAATLDGSIFNGYMFADEPGPDALGSPPPALERALPRHNLLTLALLLSALAFPWLKTAPLTRRLLAFAWVAMLSTFVLMLPFRSAGAGPQHIVLLYPLPQIIVGTSCMAAFERPALRRLARAVLLVTAISCVLVTGAYALQCRSNGFSVYWTDAIYPLYSRLSGAGIHHAIAADWGIDSPLIALSRGRISVAASDGMEAAELQRMADMGVVLIQHSETATLFPEQLRKVHASAADAGVRLVPLSAVPDAHGRPVFEVLSLRRDDASPAKSAAGAPSGIVGTDDPSARALENTRRSHD